MGLEELLEEIFKSDRSTLGILAIIALVVLVFGGKLIGEALSALLGLVFVVCFVIIAGFALMALLRNADKFFNR
jgi:Mn2+/Fe2+ NRAMP family transporter